MKSKKLSTVVSLIFILIFVLSACQSAGGNVSKEGAFITKPVDRLTPEESVEYEVARERYIEGRGFSSSFENVSYNAAAPKTREIMVNNKNEKLDYAFSSTYRLFSGEVDSGLVTGMRLNEYMDSDENLYVFNLNGDLVEYYNKNVYSQVSSSDDSLPDLSEDTIKQLVNDWVSALIPDGKAYEIEVEPPGYSQRFVYYTLKLTDLIQTGMRASVGKDGTILHVNIFPCIDIPEITADKEKELLAKVDEIVHKTYAGQFVSYEVSDGGLNKYQEGYGVLFSVVFTDTSEYGAKFAENVLVLL